MKTLYSKAPKQLPPLGLMLGDLIGSKTPESIGKHLGVSPSTVRRWLSKSEAPRAAMLALFWETQWGQSIIDCDAVNQVRMQEGLNRALKNENASLRARIARLEALGGGFGAANEPMATGLSAHGLMTLNR
jgi:hypothetical protein